MTHPELSLAACVTQRHVTVSALLETATSNQPSIIESGCGQILQFRHQHGRQLRKASLCLSSCPGTSREHRRRELPPTFASISAAQLVSSPDGPSTSGRPAHFERLPVALKKGDKLLQYVWDGQRLVPMDEEALRATDAQAGRITHWFSTMRNRLHEAFLPDAHDVTPDYWEWLRWRLSQRFFSSTMQNFSFSALLMATGLGAKKAFAASAAINWLLKDGVSRIVRMTVSTSFGQTFDADLKRMRFVTSLIFTAFMSGEFLTPFFPQHFVALASLSSVGRAVGLSAFVATQPAFQASLSNGGNLADLTSKNQAQHMVMDMCALCVSAGLTWLLRGAKRWELLLPVIAYPICASGDLYSIFRELKAIQLRVLNRERAEMVVERWLRSGGRIATAAEISAAESLVLPTEVWGGLLPLRIGPLEQTAEDPTVLARLLKQFSGEHYVLHVRGGSASQQHTGSSSANSSSGISGQKNTSSSSGSMNAISSSGSGNGSGSGSGPLTWLQSMLPGSRSNNKPCIYVSLSEGASPNQILKAVLHAACLRQQLLEQLGYITTTTPSYASSSSSVSINSSSKHHSPIAQRGGSRRHGAEADGSESDAGANPPQSSSQRCRQRHMNAGSKSSHGSGAQQHHGSLWLSSAPLTHMLDVHAHGPGLDDASTHHVHAHVGIHHQHAGLAGASSSISGSDSHTNSVSQQNRDQCKQRSENARPLVGSYGFDTDTPALPLSPLPQLPAMLLHGVASDVWWQLSVSSQHAAAQAHDHLTRDLKASGWKLRPFLLNTTEKATYVRL